MDPVAYYRQRLAQHGPTLNAIDAGSEQSHARRLRVLAEIIPHWSATILDVGCGLGHFIDYGMKVERAGYRGIDRLPEMIEAARKRRPGWRFEVGDISKPDDTWQADYVVASGLFQFEPSDGYLVILGNLWNLARRGVAVNFLRAGSDEEFLCEPHLLLKDVFQWTPYVMVRADYLPNDFTIFLFKEPPWA